MAVVNSPGFRHWRQEAPVLRIVVADSRCPRDGKFIRGSGSRTPHRACHGAVRPEKVDRLVDQECSPPTDNMAVVPVEECSVRTRKHHGFIDEDIVGSGNL